MRRGRGEGLLARLRSAGLLPRKGLGQHFLLDPRILSAIADAAGVGPTDDVLEVGTGPGTLTRELARRARRVLTVEVDAALLDFAASELGGVDNIEFLRANALGPDGGVNPQLLSALQGTARFLWVSNLPYQIATPLIVSVCESDLGWARAALTVQEEVAERIAAAPGGGHYGATTALVGYWAEAALGRRIAPGSFSPPPKVRSRVLILQRRDPIGGRAEYARYRSWVKRLFLARRKQSGGLLREALGEARGEAIRQRLGWDPRRRPETLSPEDFLALSRLASPGGNPPVPPAMRSRRPRSGF